MDDAAGEMVTEAGWKLRTLQRTQRYHTDAEMILLYKAQLLSFIEYRTPGIYHATRSVLAKVDEIQTRFLQNAGLDEVTALMQFKLAPLSMRRDIAMLGMVHRAALGEGPPQMRRLIERAPGGFQVLDPYRGRATPPLIRRSAWGLLPVYKQVRQRSSIDQNCERFLVLSTRASHIIDQQGTRGRRLGQHIFAAVTDISSSASWASRRPSASEVSTSAIKKKLRRRRCCQPSNRLPCARQAGDHPVHRPGWHRDPTMVPAVGECIMRSMTSWV